jgi:hypothetical protein
METLLYFLPFQQLAVDAVERLAQKREQMAVRVVEVMPMELLQPRLVQESAVKVLQVHKDREVRHIMLAVAVEKIKWEELTRQVLVEMVCPILIQVRQSLTLAVEQVVNLTIRLL